MFRKAPLIAALAVSALFASAAPAHPKLTASSPVANATVASPSRIELNFSEKLVGQFSGVDLVMTDMPGMKMNAPMMMAGINTIMGPDGKTLIATLAKPLSAGTYKLDYHVVSADTHRIKGSYVFKVK